jgi:hypothetical protein
MAFRVAKKKSDLHPAKVEGCLIFGLVRYPVPGDLMPQ